MRITLLLTVAIAAIHASQSSASAEIVIDNFADATDQFLEATASSSTVMSSRDGTASDLFGGGNIIGGERDAVLTRTFGTGSPGSKVSMDIGSGTGLKTFSEFTSTDGLLRITYDGADNGGGAPAAGPDGDGLVKGGLGGIDLTTGGNTVFALENIDYFNNTEDLYGRVTVYTDDADDGTYVAHTRVFVILGDNLFTGTEDGIISFASFGTGIAFNRVGAIVFELDTNLDPGTNITIDRIVARGDGGPQDSPLPTPEPASIALFSIGAFALLGFCMIRRRKERLAEMVA